jgi:hypothetical protein
MRLVRFLAALAAFSLFDALIIGVPAQTPGPGRGKGKGKSGKAEPSAPAPRNAQGRVIFGPPPGGRGFWGGGGSIVGKGRGGLETNLTEEEVPLQPWARALYKIRQKEG